MPLPSPAPEWNCANQRGRKLMGDAIVPIAQQHGFEVERIDTASDVMITMTLREYSASIWIDDTDLAAGHLLTWKVIAPLAINPPPLARSFLTATGSEVPRRPRSKGFVQTDDFNALLASLDEGLALMANSEAIDERQDGVAKAA